MKIYNVTTSTKIDRYVGWKVPLIVETEERQYSRTFITDEDLEISQSETSYNETDEYDGSNQENWNKYMTNTSSTKTMTVETFENVFIDDNPSRFYAMHNPLERMVNPQTDREKASALVIEATLSKIEPHVGKQVYIGKQGRCHYFMKPERMGNGIKMNCTMTWSPFDE